MIPGFSSPVGDGFRKTSNPKKRKKSCNGKPSEVSESCSTLQLEKKLSPLLSSGSVSLMFEGRVIGTASPRVSKANQDSSVAKRVHGNNLTGLEKRGEWLVVVGKVKIHALFFCLKYIFACSDLE